MLVITIFITMLHIFNGKIHYKSTIIHYKIDYDYVSHYQRVPTLQKSPSRTELPAPLAQPSNALGDVTDRLRLRPQVADHNST